MTSSSSPPLECVLDTMILVYGLLRDHPATTPCEQLLRARTGWFTSPLVLFEAKAVLTKVYGEDPALVSQKLAQVAHGPVEIVDLARADVAAVFQLADAHSLDLTDAALLHLAQTHGARFLASDDHRLVLVCSRLGIAPLSPFDSSLREAVGAWEAGQLPAKGVSRVLRRVHQWLSQTHAGAAQDFWSLTGGGCHLP